jgi:hypothetical protein
MPVHIENMTSQVTVADGDMPLSQVQLEKLMAQVLQRLERQQRLAEQDEEAIAIRPAARPRVRNDG